MAGLLKQSGLSVLARCRCRGSNRRPAEGRVASGFAASPGKEARDAGLPSLSHATLGDRLNAEKEFLLLLVHGMETEFLATGNALMGLARELGGNQMRCQALADLTLGTAPDAAVPFAFQLLKKSEDLVLASYDQYDHVFSAFRELQSRLARLSKEHQALMRLLSPLAFISIAFRIEASRHPVEVQQAFATLASDVTRTVAEVRVTMDRQFTELGKGERHARAVMDQISASIQQHRKGVSATLASSRQQLHDLGKALTRSDAGSTDLAHRNQSVARHINDIVMAQQCQDITRQRIEHVGEAMDAMRDHLNEAPSATRRHVAEIREFVSRVGRIQLRQVESVFDQLHQAAVTLASGFQGLRTESTAAAELAVRMGDSTLDAHATRQCQSGVREILAIVQLAVQRIADILAAFRPLEVGFVDCTAKATALARDVRLAGLNAQIFAIHAPTGATLEVLAGRVRQISEDVIQHVAQMGASLDDTTQLVAHLQERLEDFQILSRAELDVLTLESTLSQAKLADLESTIPRLTRSVTDQQRTFADSVEAVLAKVRFPATVAAARSRSVSFFSELARWGGDGCPADTGESTASRKIDLLQSKYTMESERRAHAVALKPAAVAAGVASVEPSIEFFDEPASTPAPDREAETAPRPPCPNPIQESDQHRSQPLDLRLHESAVLAATETGPSEANDDNVEFF